MSKHKPTCRCVECDGNRTMRPGEQTGVVSLSWLRRLLREYRKAMRLLERIDHALHYQERLTMRNEIEAILTEWGEGK